jgi:hypothetical protein
MKAGNIFLSLNLKEAESNPIGGVQRSPFGKKWKFATHIIIIHVA